MNRILKAAYAVLILTLIPGGLPSAWALKIGRKGNAADVTTRTSQAICLAGGGSDDEWAQGWKYLLDRSGGGDVVILCDVDTCSDYDDWILTDPEHHGFPKVNSVTSIEIASAEDANRPEVEKAVRNAEMIFFPGGDQAVYVDRFRASRLASAVDYVMNEKKAPVSGTSAGMAVLAGIDYGAHHASPTPGAINVTSEDVLRDPMGKFVDLDRAVFTPPFMSQVVTDTHFSERSRRGRIVGFMARAVANGYPGIHASNIKGIAADEGTAVCFDSSGVARVFGAGNAFFLKGNSPIERIGTFGPGKGRAPAVDGGAPCPEPSANPGAPVAKNADFLKNPGTLHWYGDRQAVKTYVISGKKGADARFDLSSWSGTGGRSEFWYVDGELGESPRFGVNP